MATENSVPVSHTLTAHTLLQGSLISSGLSHIQYMEQQYNILDL